MSKLITITKLDHAGHERFSYEGQLECYEPEVVVARCCWDRLPAVDVGPLRIEPGDTMLEYYYRQHWFNIFEVIGVTGELKGWYCNVAEAVELGPVSVRWRDLALDLVVLPDGRQVVLDEDEFTALQLDADQNARAKSALALLRTWAAERHPPFRSAPLSSPSAS